MRGDTVHRWAEPGRLTLTASLLALLLLVPGIAAADDEEEEPTRPARFTWDEKKKNLYLSVSYGDIVDDEIRKKLRRGLPTTIMLTGTIYRKGSDQPLSTTVHTCRITWHVWNEYYIVEIRQPNRTRVVKTVTLNGVLRRCVYILGTRPRQLLLAGVDSNVPFGKPLFLRAKVQVNPISPEIIDKIKRWVSRPSGTDTAAPGDALFSTFTGLFLKRIGDAERVLEFRTPAVVPTVYEPPKKDSDG